MGVSRFLLYILIVFFSFLYIGDYRLCLPRARTGILCLLDTLNIHIYLHLPSSGSGIVVWGKAH
jgi:TM2 domain-containing membrane protein YozV